MCDGSVLAQLSPTDMKVPIQYALTYPDRDVSALPSLDLTRIKALEFFKVDNEKFPLVSLARQAMEEGESFPIALNAANEIAVSAFLKKKIGFAEIAGIIARVVESHQKRKVKSLDDIMSVDQEERQKALNLLEERP
jgi:1-deoxy-D-xylulose-5-phosphate reductoisomerase